MTQQISYCFYYCYYCVDTHHIFVKNYQPITLIELDVSHTLKFFQIMHIYIDCDGHTSEIIHCTVSNARRSVHVLAELTCKLGKTFLDKGSKGAF